ncbi:transglycosylase domain-containing protein [Pseudonocardia sp.]|uniref:transglycosylase domain-containing protein n=1 Tax=Pseudonocardia sp. TaxID=60912 RepID=UPI00261B6809|nr:transglycosylase domain-containing protein [Pseudonocardia sp.]
MPPQRHQPSPPPGPEDRGPYQSGDMPLLTHEETGTESVARTRAVALAERPPPGARAGRAPGSPTSVPLSGWAKVRRAVYVLLGLAVLGPLLAFAIGWFLFRVPTPEEVAVQQVATFTYADGSDLAVERPDGVNRVVVRLPDVPEHVIDAVLAAENRSFFTDPGFDITGIMRAVYNQLTGGVGGGSTITQQYVKVVTEDDAFSLFRKYKEVVLAVKISREQSKEQILENYLNVIYLGRGAYGIQAASEAFFGKPVQEISVSEAAMLAGAIQAPSRWDPEKDLEGSQRRWTYVLDQMEQAGFLTPAQRAEQTFPATVPTEGEGAADTTGIPNDANFYVWERARQEVLDRGIVTEQEFLTEGLTVTTTVEPARQREAVAAVTDQLDGQPEQLRAALVSVDPRTGGIVAYYGGAQGSGLDYAQTLHQPGSSFKPFVFAAALQGDEGVGLGTMYDGRSGQELAGTVVRNSEGYDCGQCTVRTAMTRSINTVFYRMGLDVGPAAVAEAAHRAGIPEDLLPDPTGGIALGDKEVHPIDMASAFGTLAADGVHREPYFVSRVTAADGRVLYESPEAPEGTQAFPAQVARNVTEAMRDVPGFAGIGLDGGRPVAGKTGTVQLGRDGQNKDAWMVGYTPSLATAVWLGTDRNEPLVNAAGRPVYGSMIPGPIWQQYMNAALDGEPVERFPDFEPIGRGPVAEYVDEDEDEDAPETSEPPVTEEPEGDGDGESGVDGDFDGDGSDATEQPQDSFDDSFFGDDGDRPGQGRADPGDDDGDPDPGE